MSVGDSETPPGRPPVTHQKSRGPTTRSARVPSPASPPPDDPIAAAMEVLDQVDGARQQNRQSRQVATIQSPRVYSCGGENKEGNDREATRCELERLLSTAGTNDKRRRIKEALDHLERRNESSGRGTALAIIVNDALAVASAAVVSSKKRHQSFAGHEHSVAMTRVGEALVPKRRSSFDRNRLELWRPKDRNEGAVRTRTSDGAGAEQPGSASAATGGGSSGGEALEPEPQPPAVSARRFTALVLPSIPEHRVLGRRVLVRETSGGGGKGGVDASRNERHQARIDDCGVQQGERQEQEREASGKLAAEGAHATTKPESSVALPRRRGEVLDVPHGLFGEASSTGVDPSHPPCAAVDGVPASFWLSTGLYPQTLTIQLLRPVAVYEVMVACGGVNAARVHLGHVNSSSVRDSSRQGGDGAGVRNGHDRPSRAAPGGRWKEGSLLELVGEQQRPSAAGGDAAGAAPGNSYGRSGRTREADPSLALAKMTFRVPGEGRPAEQVDRLSLVVMSAQAPFCLVTSVTIRGQIGVDGEEE